MKKNPILFVLFFCLVFPRIGSARFGYGKASDIEALQSRRLIVVVQQPREKVLKKLKKKNQEDRIQSYGNAIAAQAPIA